MKAIFRAVSALFLTALFAALSAIAVGLPVVPTVAAAITVSTIFSFAPRPQGVASGVVLEQWAAYIIERFWKDNGFLRCAYDDSQYVVAGRIIHIPNPGSKPAVQKNRASFPGVAVRRSDTDVNYALDEYTTDPTHIPNIDAIHLSYSKQDSVMGDHMQVLSEIVADDMLIKWGTNAAIVATTGGPTAGTQGPVTGQTGNRLGLSPKDLSALMVRANADNVPKTDRYALIDDNMFGYLYDQLSDTQTRDFSRTVDPETGVIGKLHSWNIMTRSSVLASNNADALKALGSSLGATDNLCSLFWQKNSVAFAIGDTKLFQDTNSAIYYGDIHSALVMAGGRVRRQDGLGIYLMKQGTPA